MRGAKRIWTAALAVGALCPVTAWSATEAASDTPSYRLETMAPLGGDRAYGAGITNSGLVAGTTTMGDGTVRAVRWRSGVAEQLGALGGLGASSAVQWPVKNNSGVVVGISQTDIPDPNNEPWSCAAFLPERLGFACRGFVWRGGEMTPLPTLGGTHSFAAGVNNHRQVVGWAETASEDSSCTGGQVLGFSAVRWDEYGARTVALPPLIGDRTSAATAINDHGRVVGISGICGDSVGKASARSAVVWDNGVPTRLDDLGGVAWNTPMSLNQRGDVAGFLNRSAADGLAFRAVPAWWTHDGTLKPLELPDGYTFGQALGINDARLIVGIAYTANFARCTATLWQNGEVTELRDLIADETVDFCTANDVNDYGQITGEATDLSTGKSVAFLASPMED